MKAVLCLSVIFHMLQPAALCLDESYRDPFIPPIVEKPLPGSGEYSEDTTTIEDYREPLGIVVEGIVWSADSQQVIIDGEVYKKGDTIKSIDAKIIEIDKEGVSILLENTIYNEKVTKKEEAR